MTKCKNKLNKKRSNSKRSKRDFQHENNGESCEKNEFKLSQKDCNKYAYLSKSNNVPNVEKYSYNVVNETSSMTKCTIKLNQKVTM